MNVLLAHDDAELGALDSMCSSRRGIRIHLAHSVSEAIRSLETVAIDAVAASASLAEGGSLALLNWLRGASDTPVIVLADEHDEGEMAGAFAAGADDYLARPYSSRELVLRLQAVCRRRRPQATAEVIEVAGLRIDRDTWTVSYLDSDVKLTRIEQRILYCLAAHIGQIAPTERLVQFTWRGQGGDTNVLKTHISHLRRKLSRAGAPVSITAVPGAGYEFQIGMRMAAAFMRSMSAPQLVAVP